MNQHQHTVPTGAVLKYQWRTVWLQPQSDKTQKALGSFSLAHLPRRTQNYWVTNSKTIFNLANLKRVQMWRTEHKLWNPEISRLASAVS